MTSHAPDSAQIVPGGAVMNRAWWPALGCVLAGAAVFQFYGNANHGYIDTSSLFYWWGYQWWNPGSETQHGWLILGLAGWLFWRNLRRPEGRGARGEGRGARIGVGGSGVWRPDWPAFAAMAAGLALHALGFMVQQARVSILALLLFTWGTLRLAGGRRCSRAAAFPLAFMVFAIPLNALDSAGFWLRMVVINASTGLAHAAGIGVIRNGTQLLAPDGHYQYDVAAACSGVRSLMALAALSLLVGYLNFRPWWLRAAVLLLCVPFTYLGNVARISSIIFAAHWGGQKWGDYAHNVMGFGVFVVVLGGVLAMTALLARVVRPEWRIDEGGMARPAVGAPPPAGSGWLVPALVVALAAGEMLLLARIGSQPLRGGVGVALAAEGTNPVELPSFLGTEWIGRRAEVTAVEREILPPDTGFSRKLYVNFADPTRAVFLSIVLSGRDRTSIHRPELCLVGQGWTIDGSTRTHFAQPAGPGIAAAFPATVLHVRREALTPRGRVVVPELVAYWFVSSDGVVATHGERFLHDAWNRLRHLRADRWAYVLMQTDATDGEAAALARMQTVLDRTLPVFQLPLPSQ